MSRLGRSQNIDTNKWYDAPVVREGYLVKKGGERRNWKTRWFVLRFNHLSYYAKPGDVKPKGALILTTASMGVSKRREFCFALHTPVRTLFLAAASQTEQSQWMASIEQATENLNLMMSSSPLLILSPPTSPPTSPRSQQQLPQTQQTLTKPAKPVPPLRDRSKSTVLLQTLSSSMSCLNELEKILGSLQQRLESSAPAAIEEMEKALALTRRACSVLHHQTLRSQGKVPLESYELQSYSQSLDLVIKCQAYIRRWLVRSRLNKVLTGPKQSAHERRRWMLIGEIISTEKTYVESLQITLEKYSQPLTSIAQKFINNNLGVTSAILLKLFSNVEEIFHFNTCLLLQLENDSSLEIGRIFLSWQQNAAPLYEVYCTNFSESLTTLETLSASTAFTEFLRQCETLTGTGLNLSSYLIMPIQRIPRYVLLLSDLLAVTQRNHPDYRTLSRAVATIREMANTLNESKRKAESEKKLEVLSNTIQGLQPSHVSALTSTGAPRLFLREGELFLVGGEGLMELPPVEEREKEGYRTQLFLLSDELLITFSSKKKWLEGTIKKKNLTLMGVIDLEKVKSVNSLPQSPGDLFCFSIELHGEPPRLVTFATPNNYLCDQWSSDIRKRLPANIRKARFKVLRFH
eukprot:TRINITY_DN4151_c0_g1_i1.p1 TRINITY_DN4151_c0_g1~~TRINITY_DN4151_c0_g1_i1.p1  ORF type:complete len:633 (+),score=128.48 TRINITY_DN4151_c0_g1_i1:13-1911(+)